MVELYESLKMLHIFIHFRSDVQWLLLLPLPEAHLLLGGYVRLAQGNYHCAIFIDIKRDDSLGMRIENGLAGSARSHIPDHEHGVPAGIRSYYHVELAIVGGC